MGMKRTSASAKGSTRGARGAVAIASAFQLCADPSRPQGVRVALIADRQAAPCEQPKRTPPLPSPSSVIYCPRPTVYPSPDPNVPR